VQPPPIFHWSPCQVLMLESLLPTGLPSSGGLLGVDHDLVVGPSENARQTCLPLLRSWR